jgi:hypothetical protein
MDPYKTCPYCGQGVRIIYEDVTTKERFLFDIHNGKDHVTKCPGSKALYSLSQDETDSLAATMAEAAQLQSSTENPSPKIKKCPICQLSVRVKKNLRGTMIFVEHYNGVKRKCPQSYKPVQ